MLHDLTYSVEDVWLIWIASITALCILVFFSLRCRNWGSVLHFFRDERGASYALPYMMTFPIYMIFVCWTVQSSMILIVKIGVMHSAHMAARSAVVWRSADPFSQSRGWELAEEKARQAATVTMVPFASGYRGHTNVYRFDPAGQMRAWRAYPQAFAYDRLYRQLASHTEAGDSLAKSDFVQRKYRYAAAMTTDVVLLETANAFNAELSTEVTFRMPIHVPLAGRLLGKIHETGQGYIRDISAKSILPLETPESPDRLLGIGYDPSLL